MPHPLKFASYLSTSCLNQIHSIPFPYRSLNVFLARRSLTSGIGLLQTQIRYLTNFSARLTSVTENVLHNNSRLAFREKCKGPHANPESLGSYPEREKVCVRELKLWRESLMDPHAHWPTVSRKAAEDLHAEAVSVKLSRTDAQQRPGRI